MTEHASSSATATATALRTSQSEAPIDILVYGLGAIGAFYTFILSRTSSVRLTVIARSNYEAVKHNGLLIRSENHGEHMVRPYAVCQNTREVAELEISRFDFVVCANKATDLERTVEDLKLVIAKGGEGGTATTIVLMQNGVGNEDPFRAAFPWCPILIGVIWVGATQDSPGIVRQHISESTTIGISDSPRQPSTDQPSPESEIHALSRFTTLFTNGDHPFTTSTSISTPRWKKCIWNAAWNSLTTLSTVDVHTWLSDPNALATTRRLMDEAISVAQALHIPDIDPSLTTELIDRMMSFTGPVWTSMYHDMRAGRAMEIEVILGGIVRKGREKNVSIPTLETVYSLLVALEGRLGRERQAKVVLDGTN